METTLPTTPIEQAPQENTAVPVESINDENAINIYPIIRHMFLIVCVLLTVSIILFLLYQNGRSLYDKGI
jgi:hypothetical protein